jgi:hypothetical protein
VKMQMEIEESGEIIMNVQDVKGGDDEVKQLIEFWSNIKNVENADPTDIQSDILTYLQEIERLKIENEVVNRQADLITKYRIEAQHLERALERIARVDVLDIADLTFSDCVEVAQQALKEVVV